MAPFFAVCPGSTCCPLLVTFCPTEQVASAGELVREITAKGSKAREVKRKKQRESSPKMDYFTHLAKFLLHFFLICNFSPVCLSAVESLLVSLLRMPGQCIVFQGSFSVLTPTMFGEATVGFRFR